VVVVVKGIGVKFTGFEMQIAGNLVVPSWQNIIPYGLLKVMKFGFQAKNEYTPQLF
jgi:hypothetical protein